MLRTMILALALVCPGLVAAQCGGLSLWNTLTDAQQAEANSRAAATPFGRGNFWSATRGDQTLWVIGTMHLPDPRHGDTLVTILPLFEDADLLLVEATLDDQSDMQTYLAENPDLMTLPDGMSLPQELDAATWDLITDATSARGLPGFMAARMQPWFLSMTLAIPPCAMTAMAGGDGGLDTQLMDLASDYDLPVAPLEPWEAMLDLLMSGTFEEQLDALQMSLVDPWLQDAMTVSLTDLYFAGQTAKAWYMSDYIGDFAPHIDNATLSAQMKEFEQVLLIDRNRAWIPVIEAAADTHDRVMVAFGAAHLFGEDGVLNLLQDNGWTIAPL